MELDTNTHPILRTTLRFEDAALVTENDDVYRVNILVEFRSFLPEETFQALERVSADILESKSVFSCPADSHLPTWRGRILPRS